MAVDLATFTSYTISEYRKGTRQLFPSRIFTINFTISALVIFSTLFILISPTQVSALTSNSIDTSSYHSSLPAPDTKSSSSQSSIFTPMETANTPTIQAALLGPATFRSTDLVSSTAIYEIQFFTSTTGVIDKIDITFPAGTGVALAGIIERVGITGPASITKSGTTVTLDLNTPVSVPAGTFVRLEMVDISNPPNPANYKISVTTKNPSNVPIDGPSLSPAYTIRQVSTGMIANGAVTKDKISSSFMTSRILQDNPTGKSFGWDPDGLETNFIIIDDVAVTSANPVLVNVGDSGTNSQCEALGALTGFFTIQCLNPPPQGSELRYTVANLGLS